MTKTSSGSGGGSGAAKDRVQVSEMTDTINESASRTTQEATTTAAAEAQSPTAGAAVDNSHTKPSEEGYNTETATAMSEESAGPQADGPATPTTTATPTMSGPIVSSSKKTRPPYKFDPDKITLRFLFANRDGLTVTIECNPTDTIGELKGSLMSVWPEGLPNCMDGDQIRLICMGKGYLMPDSRTLGECEIPVFKTHPTPINVSVRPEVKTDEDENTASLLSKRRHSGGNRATNAGGRGGDAANRGQQSNDNSNNAVNQEQASQGCTCILL